MYGSLGYIDQGRRTVYRDSSFLGTSGHPSRKDMSGARRPVSASMPIAYAPPAPSPRVAEPGSAQPTFTPPATPAASAATSAALLERRCVFLEDQDKRRAAEIADLRARLAETAAASVRPETVCGTAVERTFAVRAGATDAATAELLRRSSHAASTPEEEVVEAGSVLQLQYPMKRVSVDGGGARVFMRRREVHPRLASVQYSWVLLFEERPGMPDRVLVSDFR